MEIVLISSRVSFGESSDVDLVFFSVYIKSVNLLFVSPSPHS
jgi:hypothetical protein